MEPKNLKIFDNKIMQAVSAFCSSNNIEDIDDFIYRCFKQGFDISKYGLLGKTLNDGEKDLKTSGIEEKHVIKEVIVEKRVEVPVEVIKEVEKIVTKIEYISDKTGESELLLKIQQLEENIFHLNNELDKEKQIFSTKTTEMENIFQNEMSKKDNELDELRRNLDVKLDENKLKMMGETLQKLKKELSLKDKKIEELESINKQLENVKVNQNATYLNGSNITRRL
jgi:hypothetical protein